MMERLYDELNRLSKRAEYLKTNIRASKLSSILDIREWWRNVTYEKIGVNRFTIMAASKGKMIFFRDVDQHLLDQLLELKRIIERSNNIVYRITKMNKKNRVKRKISVVNVNNEKEKGEIGSGYLVKEMI